MHGDPETTHGHAGGCTLSTGPILGVKRRLRHRVAIHKRYSFWAEYRWMRSAGYSRRMAVEHCAAQNGY